MSIHLLCDNDFTKCNIPKIPDAGKILITSNIQEVTCNKCLGIKPGRKIGKYADVCSGKHDCKCKICRLRDRIISKYYNDNNKNLKRTSAMKLATKFVNHYVSGWGNKKGFNEFFKLVTADITSEMIQQT